MKVAFCAPFYGVRAAGGAEAECRITAEQLHLAGTQVEIFTTCLFDLQHDWNVNAYRPGTSIENGVTVHRFPAEKCCKPRFAALNQRLLNGEALTDAEEEEYLSLSIVSTALLRALDRKRHEFSSVCFIPYLFGTTCYGVDLLREQAVLIPCLHDENYARIRRFGTMFNRCGKIVFHAQAEQTLAHQLYDYPAEKDLLLGEGITTEFESDPQRFRQRFNIPDPFILCAGRQHTSKNTHELIRCFLQFKQQNPSSPLKLVLIGPGSIPFPPNADIIDLGYVSVQEKRDAFSAATLFCQPSIHESFSIVLMEAWDCKTPALVHADCAVTREHAIRCGGGLYFGSSEEFSGCVKYLLEHPDQAAQMGAAGQAYVRANFSWSHIVQRYQSEVFATPATA